MSLFLKIKYQLISYGRIALSKLIGLFRTYELEKSILIFGEPRTGTTWLMELLSKDKRCIVVWEPLHSLHGLVPADLKHEPRIFEIPSNSKSPLKKHIEDILTLKKVNGWTMNFTTGHTILRSDHTLTKFVRGTLLLPWIAENFSFIRKPIYIMRHPIATALSQIEGEMDIKREMMSQSIFKMIYPSRHEEYQHYINNLTSELERLVAMWSLYCKRIVEYQKERQNLIIVYYEDLLLNPIIELKNIISLCDLDIDIDLLNIRKPSQSDFGNKLMKDPMAQLSKWQQQISSSDIANVQRILDYFEIKLYSSRHVLPIKQF